MHADNIPTLTVIITNYNHGRFVDEALNAIVSQSVKPDEIIIVDDASTDNSAEVIALFAKENKRVQFLKNKTNRGVLHNGNKLLRMAGGDFIFWAASDDIVLPGFFEQSLGMLSLHPNAGLCFSDPATLDDATGAIKEAPLFLTGQPDYFSPDALADLVRRKSFTIDSHTAIVNRTGLIEAGGYMPDLKWCSDWFVMQLLGFRKGACYVPKALTAFRIFPASYYNAGAGQPEAQDEIVRRILEYLDSAQFRDALPLFLRSGILSSFHINLLRVALKNRRYRRFLSSETILKSIRLAIINKLYPVTPESLKRLYRLIAGRQRKKEEGA
ncbi:MAG: glycosyltransferase family 2 protein [Nitrospiraceae bacterium]|nr:glycosyltransferase family 2 protein [Nitrospiraceae bacterium]